MLAHNHPAYLARLISRSSHSEAVFFAHIDKHGEITAFLQSAGNRENIRFVKNRIKVFYRDYSSVVAILNQ